MPSNPYWHRPEIAARFQDAGIVEAYDYREPYPPGVFEILRDLIVETPRVVLDIGCGRGELARPLLAMAERVDAVDWSQAMIAKGKTLSGGDDPRLRWIYGRVEEVALEPPYALITAGGSLHWMDWDVVLPHLSEILTPQGCLALPNRRSQRPVWAAQTQHLIERFSTNPDYREADMIS